MRECEDGHAIAMTLLNLALQNLHSGYIKFDTSSPSILVSRDFWLEFLHMFFVFLFRLFLGTINMLFKSYIVWSKILNWSVFKEKSHEIKWLLNWIHTMKNAIQGDLFSTVAGMRAYSYTEKELYHRCFLVKFVEFIE